MLLAHLTDNPEFPTPIGIFRQISKPTYDEGVEDQIKPGKKSKGEGDLKNIIQRKYMGSKLIHS